MARIHKIVGYIIDFEGNYPDWTDCTYYLIDNNKYGGYFINIDSKTTKSFEWEDTLDINHPDCPLENYEKYFKKRCKDCTSCNFVEYERRNKQNENYKVQRYECWGVKEPFEIKDINQYCTEY